ncbi:MAG: c-type cytochrome biogenesis protein CcmI [Burkholderiales bacterium 28-67-8]|nr:MAG: c-type cytochrome biogenesis protein CcmI [Burkholderiales bacterium 28-67-8]
MMTFWILTALLMALALAMVLPTLIKHPPGGAALDESVAANRTTLAILRDQLAQLNAELASGSIDAEQHRVSREEIERRVLEETGTGSAASGSAAGRASARRPWATLAVIAVAIPLLATAAYHRLGNPAAIDAPAAVQAAVGPDGVTAEQVEGLVKQLAERMKSNPDDVQGWTLLARTYGAMQKFPEAAQAYERATALSPNDATLLADRADVMAVLQGQRAAGEPAKLIARALELDPKNLKALALAGSVAYEAGDYDQAIAHWTKARELAAPASDFANNLEQGIKDARAAQGGSAATAGGPSTPANASPETGAASGQTTTASANARVTGRVTLSPQLASKVSPGDTVFIFAKAIEGPRMPLAIVRKTVADLPISFTLDDSMAMSPAMKLSNFPAVVVGARISKSGNAMPSPGDLSGQISGVKIGAEGVQIVIDTVQP